MERIAVAFVIDWNKIHHHDVHGGGIQIANANLKRRKHASPGFCDDHLSALLMEFIPQWFRFQHNICMHQSRMIGGGLLIRINFLGIAALLAHIRLRIIGVNCRLLEVIRHILIDVLQWFV